MNTTEKVKSPIELLFLGWQSTSGDTLEENKIYDKFCTGIPANQSNENFLLIGAGISAAQLNAFTAGFKIAKEMFSGGKA